MLFYHIYYYFSIRKINVSCSGGDKCQKFEAKSMGGEEKRKKHVFEFMSHYERGIKSKNSDSYIMFIMGKSGTLKRKVQ